MSTPEHIKRIIERLDPVDREALEQHLKDKSIMGDLMCLQEIRAAIGDPHGKLMQDEVVGRVQDLARLTANLDEVRDQAVLHFANSVQRDSIHSPTLKALAKHYAEQLRKEDQ